MEEKTAISNLKNGESFIIPQSDYGKAEVWLINEMYVLFSIPLFGGKPVFEKVYQKSKLDEMLTYINSWT